MMVVAAMLVIVIVVVRGSEFVDLSAMAHFVVAVSGPCPCPIRAGFGFKGRFQRRDTRAELPRHILEHMVRGDAQIAVADLHGHVAVAEVVRHRRQGTGRLAFQVEELFRLRDEARKRMGDRFDLRAFHDAVLAHGAVPLSSLERLLREHAQSVAGEAPSRAGRGAAPKAEAAAGAQR